MSTRETVIFVGGRIHTMDARGRVAEALASRDGKAVAVGAEAEIEAAFPGAERVDG